MLVLNYVRSFNRAVFPARAAAIALGLVDHISIRAFSNGLVGAFGLTGAAVDTSIGVNNVYGHNRFLSSGKSYVQ